MTMSMPLFDFAGRQMQLLPDRGLFWPARRALLVADLHLEKASWFAMTGQMLPPFDSQATLARLAAMADACDALEIWALGDSFHDAVGPERLESEAQALLARIARRRRLIWIAGNHDAAADMPGERCDEAEIDGLILRHEARPDEPRPELSGHFHPKVRITTAMRTVSRPCAVMGSNRIILPAFGALTGGLDAHSPPIMALFPQGGEALVATQASLLRLPLTMSAQKRPPRARRSRPF
jgi:DNA ligase-associated metallophosphoesterase